MEIINEDDGRVFECYLGDDGTLDTVIHIDNQTFRFSQEYVAHYRDKAGTLSDEGFNDLCNECIDDMYWE